jgi:hypothetical protein
MALPADFSAVSFRAALANTAVAIDGDRGGALALLLRALQREAVLELLVVRECGGASKKGRQGGGNGEFRQGFHFEFSFEFLAAEGFDR